MAQTVEVPGQGAVEFPDGMSNDDIARVIRLHVPEPDAKGSPEWATWRNQRVQDLNSSAQKPPPEDQGFLHGLWQAVNPFPALKDLAIGVNPYTGIPGGPQQGVQNLVSNAVHAGVTQAHKAAEAWRNGDRTEAVGHAMAAALPVLGPAAANAGEAIGEGRTGEGLGQAAGLLGTVVAPDAAGAAASTVDKLAPGAAPAVADALKTAGEKQYARVLAPATKANKLRTANVVPGLIDRGVTGATLSGIQRTAQAQIERVGQAIGDEWQNLPAGTSTPLAPIYNRLQNEIENTHSVAGSSGKLIPKGPVAATAIKNIEALQQVLTDVAESDPQSGELVLPVEKVRDLRQYFDTVQKQAGAFEGTNLSQQSVAAAHQVAADAIRQQLGNQFPDIDALNKEYSFWKDVAQVTSDTLARRQGQGTPLAAKIAQGAGFVKGGVLGAEAMKGLTTAVSSPAWGTVSAVLKDRLADALAQGARGPAEFYVGKIGQAIGASGAITASGGAPAAADLAAPQK